MTLLLVKFKYSRIFQEIVNICRELRLRKAINNREPYKPEIINILLKLIFFR
jgi:hypothetical protein